MPADRFEKALDDAWALLEGGDAVAAARTLQALLDGGRLGAADEADARHMLGQAFEEQGDMEAATREWLVVARLDARLDPPQPLMAPHEFERLAAAALEELPGELQVKLQDVAVVVDDRPSDGMVSDGIDPRILGLYSGVPYPSRSTVWGAPYPEVIHLFQRNLEAQVDDAAQLARQIRLTVIHETAHYFGYSEAELRRMGLG
ncbi:MAG: metallopeptidase family protein [Actinobacteria bacterium]|nr:metallopeptidase family protein [Actinomycetota bacterium]